MVRDLFRDYNKLIRPVEVMNETVEVEFGLSFIQLINVVSKVVTETSSLSPFLSITLSFFFPLIRMGWLHTTYIVPIKQNEKNQIMTSNVWLQMVSTLFFRLSKKLHLLPFFLFLLHPPCSTFLHVLSLPFFLFLLHPPCSTFLHVLSLPIFILLSTFFFSVTIWVS